MGKLAQDSIERKISERRKTPPQPLKYIKRTLELLRPEENELGNEINWKNLYERVKPWSNGMELSDNIREVVKEYVNLKIPILQENIHTIADLDDEELLEALVNNWFSEYISEVEGQRREVLLAVVSHIIKRIETFTYQNIFENLSEEEFESKLGMSSKFRNLLIELLKVSRKADPLFIRFLAFSQLSPEAPKEASSTSIYIPGDDKPHTIASLWPEESLFISRHFYQIVENSQEWIDEPGADAFKKYIETLALQYKETDPLQSEVYLKAIEVGYEELLRSQFPITLVSGTTEGDLYSPKYIDPEIKVSISTPDSRAEEPLWEMARKGMAQSLDIIGAGEYKENIMQKPIRSVIAIGSHGINLIFNAVAQENPGITVFLNEQVRAYDRNFISFIEELIGNCNDVFPERNTPEGKLELERMSRSNTVYHEIGHGICPSESSEAQRLGAEPLLILDEVKAETLYRCLIPLMIENGSISGSREKWAVAMLASSCQFLRDQPTKGDDPYYHAAVFTLNKLFENDIVVFDGKKIEIRDFDAFYVVQKQIADEILGLYRDVEANEKKTRIWIKKNAPQTLT